MPTLLRLADAVTAANRALAAALAWAVLVMVLLTFAIAAARYGLGRGSIALQETVIYLHALVFMLCAAAALADDAHVRVDIFHSRWGPRRRAAVDLAGHLLFLLPFCGFLLAAAWGYVSGAWATREASPEPGGLPLVWLLKSVILVLAAQLALQGLAGAVQAASRLRASA